MKKLVASILCLVLMISSFAFAAEVYEKPEFNILVNGVEVDKTDVPIVIDGRTLVPLRTLAVALGVPNDEEHINWDGEKRQVIVIDEYVSIVLYIDSNVAYVNGEEKTIDVPATLYNGRTYLPARFVAEAFDKEVGWDAATTTVTINEKVEINLGEVDTEAVALLKKSQKAMKDVKSLKSDVDMLMDMTVQGLTVNLDLDGTMSVDMDKKQMYGDFDFDMNMMGMKVPAEMYLYMENDKMYSRTITDGEDTGWLDAAQDSGVAMTDVWGMAEQSEQMEMPEEFYAAFETTGVEDGCTVIKTKENLANVLNIIAKQFLNSSMAKELVSNASFDLGKVDYKMYINNSTNYTDKVEMAMNMNLETDEETVAMDINIVMNMSEFNSVNITKPTM